MTAPRRSDREIASEAITDHDVDDVLAEFANDPRRAIRALLEGIATLALDKARTTSRGYVRGRIYMGIDMLKLP
ncbi:MAG: hypothetical protein JNK84_21875 [Phreatobacter sp.]|uniref:hypothetical protein n=1 Tax=Phreatobacter sp. TaxID=1966341 RepID=UPI001A43DFF4|nr:hypothetical protein [Phreatobacter sp.]MBL8571733.1 hypothetical protein [Phreatobacter sp.]